VTDTNPEIIQFLATLNLLTKRQSRPRGLRFIGGGSSRHTVSQKEGKKATCHLLSFRREEKRESYREKREKELERRERERELERR
jgi:hypothetical protein